MTLAAVLKGALALFSAVIQAWTAERQRAAGRADICGEG